RGFDRAAGQLADERLGDLRARAVAGAEEQDARRATSSTPASITARRDRATLGSTVSLRYGVVANASTTHDASSSFDVVRRRRLPSRSCTTSTSCRRSC